MKNKLLYFFDWLLIFYSLLAISSSIYFIFKVEYYLSAIPYLAESVLYFVLRIVYRDKRFLIIAFTIINFVLIITHIVITFVSIKFTLIGYLSLQNGVVLISSFLAVYATKHNDKLTFSLIVYFIVLLIFAYLFRPAFQKYQKYSWVNACLKNQVKENAVLGIPKAKTKEHCNCVYKILIDRYKKMENFPTEENFSKKDQVDIFNCTVDFLMPDSINKDSIKRNIDDYIIE